MVIHFFNKNIFVKMFNFSIMHIVNVMNGNIVNL